MMMQEMIKNFDLDAYEKAFFSSEYHKKDGKDLLEVIKQRIKEYIKHDKIKSPEVHFLMELALRIRAEENKKFSEGIKMGAYIKERQYQKLYEVKE